jgi:sugar O-acyltransferase (sialic acid O-acetyltransferase NeuD family)
MKQLLIIGARGMGREIFFLAQHCVGYGVDYVVKGFLDDKVDALDSYPGYAPILGSVEDHEVSENEVFFCAMGDVKYRYHYVDVIRRKGGVFLSLVHSTASVFSTSSIGSGCFIGPQVHITADVRVGAFTAVFWFTLIGHDVMIGEFCHLGAHSFIGGHVEICDLVTLHPGTKVLPHKKIGTGATVGAGSVVVRNVKPGTTVFGSPAIRLV